MGNDIEMSETLQSAFSFHCLKTHDENSYFLVIPQVLMQYLSIILYVCEKAYRI